MGRSALRTGSGSPRVLGSRNRHHRTSCVARRAAVRQHLTTSTPRPPCCQQTSCSPPACSLARVPCRRSDLLLCSPPAVDGRLPGRHTSVPGGGPREMNVSNAKPNTTTPRPVRHPRFRASATPAYQAIRAIRTSGPAGQPNVRNYLRTALPSCGRRAPPLLLIRCW